MSLSQRSQNALKSVRGRVFASTSRIVKTFEQTVGIEEVRHAQDNVLKFEGIFTNSQSERRTKQQELTELQTQLKSVQNQLSKLSRSDDRYLDLVTNEHGLLRKESTLRNELSAFEQAERAAFSQLSTALRYSHDRERVYGERTKYFSLIGSVAGALVGAFATGLSGYLRVRELHTAVDASANQCLQLQEMVGRLEQEVTQSSEKNVKFIEEFRQLVGINSAAILLAGVGEEKPANRSTKGNYSDGSTSQELVHFMSLTNNKLASIESTLNKLSPVVDDETSTGGLVVRCDHLNQPQPDPNVTAMSTMIIADEINQVLNEKLRNYTLTMGSLAVISGVAVALSLIFSLR